jgi:hypothetical protein
MEMKKYICSHVISNFHINQANNPINSQAINKPHVHIVYCVCTQSIGLGGQIAV